MGDGNNPYRFRSIDIDDGEWKLAEQDMSRFFKVCECGKPEGMLGYCPEGGDDCGFEMVGE